MPPQLAAVPPLPRAVAYLWHWHLELVGPSPFTWVELDSWSRLRGIPITGEEAQALRLLDLHHHNPTPTK